MEYNDKTEYSLFEGLGSSSQHSKFSCRHLRLLSKYIGSEIKGIAIALTTLSWEIYFSMLSPNK